jgi:hypothetical protein
MSRLRETWNSVGCETNTMSVQDKCFTITFAYLNGRRISRLTLSSVALVIPASRSSEACQ